MSHFLSKVDLFSSIGNTVIVGKVKAGNRFIFETTKGASWTISNPHVLPSHSPLLIYRLDVTAKSSTTKGNRFKILSVVGWSWEVLSVDKVMRYAHSTYQVLSESSAVKPQVVFREADYKIVWDPKTMAKHKTLTLKSVTHAQVSDPMLRTALHTVLEGCFLTRRQLVARHVLGLVLDMKDIPWNKEATAALKAKAEMVCNMPYLLIHPNRVLLAGWPASVTPVAGGVDPVSVLSQAAQSVAAVVPDYLFSSEDDEKAGNEPVVPTWASSAVPDVVVYAAGCMLLHAGQTFEKYTYTLCDLTDFGSMLEWKEFTSVQGNIHYTEVEASVGKCRKADADTVCDVARSMLVKDGILASSLTNPRHCALKNVHDIELEFFNTFARLAAGCDGAELTLVDNSVASLSAVENAARTALSDVSTEAKHAPLVVIVLPEVLCDPLHFANETMSNKIIGELSEILEPLKPMGCSVYSETEFVTLTDDSKACIHTVMLLQVSRWSLNGLSAAMCAMPQAMKMLCLFDDWLGSMSQFHIAMKNPPHGKLASLDSRVVPGRMVFDTLMKNVLHLPKALGWSRVNIGFIDSGTSTRQSFAGGHGINGIGMGGIPSRPPMLNRIITEDAFNVPLDRQVSAKVPIAEGRAAQSDQPTSDGTEAFPALPKSRRNKSSMPAGVQLGGHHRGMDLDTSVSVLREMFIDEDSSAQMILMASLKEKQPELQRVVRVSAIVTDDLMVDRFIFGLPHWPAGQRQTRFGDKEDVPFDVGAWVNKVLSDSSDGVMFKAPDLESVLSVCEGKCHMLGKSVVVYAAPTSRPFIRYLRSINTETKRRAALRKGMYAKCDTDGMFVMLHEKVEDNSGSESWVVLRYNNNIAIPEACVHRPGKRRISSALMLEKMAGVMKETVSAEHLHPAQFVVPEESHCTPAADVVILNVGSTADEIEFFDWSLVDQMVLKAGKILAFVGSDGNIKKAMRRRRASSKFALESALLRRAMDNRQASIKNDIRILNGSSSTLSITERSHSLNLISSDLSRTMACAAMSPSIPSALTDPSPLSNINLENINVGSTSGRVLSVGLPEPRSLATSRRSDFLSAGSSRLGLRALNRGGSHAQLDSLVQTPVSPSTEEPGGLTRVSPLNARRRANTTVDLNSTARMGPGSFGTDDRGSPISEDLSTCLAGQSAMASVLSHSSTLLQAASPSDPVATPTSDLKALGVLDLMPKFNFRKNLNAKNE